LIIFFVLVIDLSQQDLEDLILPKAVFAVPDDTPPDLRPIVNITQNGDVYYKKKEYYNAALHKENYDGLEELLRLWHKELDLKMEPLGPTNPTLAPSDPVLIRADKWTEWHYIGKFMTACSQPYARFWKLELAMSEEDKEAKAVQAQAAAN
jgi:biopolymer transport protein ExbD